MKRIFGLLILVCLCSTTRSQETISKAFYPHFFIKDPSNTTEIEKYLHSFLRSEMDDVTLVLNAKTESPAAFHYLFQQEYLATSIQHATIKINVSKLGKVISIYSNLINLNQLSKTITYPSNEMEEKFSHWQINHPELKIISKSFCFKVTSTALIPAIQIYVRDKNEIAQEIVLDQYDEITTTITSVFFAQDSSISGKVFNPDPLTSAGLVYGGSYQDFNDSDAIVLNNQRVSQSFTAEFNGSAFSLKNQYVELRDNNGDGIQPVSQSSPIFDFTRHQNGFEDVNTFYHISKQSNYIMSLGFNASSQKVYPDPHGGTADNSFFNEPNSIYFGTGGVDDAEDADVLIHEYTHFISYNAAPSTNIGLERNGIDEGTCDYFAASYSKAINSYNWSKVFNWDGNPPFWSGRTVNSTKHYPQNISNNIYKDGEIWSSTLMQIHDELGRGTTDSLVLQTIYLFAPNMSYIQAANALLQADTLLFGGENYCPIYYYLFQRGYLPLSNNPCGFNGILESKIVPVDMVNSKNGFSFTSENSEIKIENYSILSYSGILVYESKSTGFNDSSLLPEGLYFIVLKTNQGNRTYKYIVP